jgi:hypothetical protein
VEKTVFTCDRCEQSSGDNIDKWHDLVPRDGSEKKALCPECVALLMEMPIAEEDGVTPAEAKALHAKAKELVTEARKQAADQEKRRVNRDQDEGHSRLAADARHQVPGEKDRFAAEAEARRQQQK